MRKLFSVVAASMLILSCFAGCGKTETSESVSSSSEVKAESDSAETTEEISEEETTEEETTEEVTEEITETTSSDDDNAEIATVAKPEYKPDTVAETDFLGKWECSKMYTQGQIVEDELYGIPLNVVAQIVVNDDGTGTFGTGIQGSEEASTAFTYEFADNRLNLTMDEDIGAEGDMYLYIQDGELVMSVDGEDELVYFKSVDELTVMTEDDLLTAMGIDPADIVAEDADADVTTEDTAADSAVIDSTESVEESSAE
jgi:hypothetical protein